ncbi:MAG: hypothetical protein JKX98_07155 [Alcanivoracaceae bacterium]|nr:hypothetical protein [Alcanivoracaceae bacterium]
MTSISNYDGEIEAPTTSVNQKNLVYNYDFTHFSNAVYGENSIDYGTPDGWQYNDQGVNGSINFNDQDFEVVIQTSNTSSLMTFKQALNEFPRSESILSNQTISASVYCNITGGSVVIASLTNEINTSSKFHSTSSSADVVFELQLKTGQSLSELIIKLESSSNVAIIKISKIYANIGQLAIPNLPCIVEGVIGETHQYLVTENAPANEISICQEAQELPANMSSLDSVINGRFGAGNTRSFLPDVPGYFMRAWDNGSGVDPNADERTALGSSNTGDKVGTLEEDQFKSHNHAIGFSTSTLLISGEQAPIPTISTISVNTGTRGGDQTRAKNIAELYTIK